jgi:integrase
VTAAQFREFFMVVDGWDIQRCVKEKYRTGIKRYLEWIIMPLMAEDKAPARNYDMIFKDRYYQFKEGGHPREEEPFTKQDVLDCLNFFRNRNERDYIMFTLDAYTGMRVGGLVSIRIQDIDFVERRIQTREKRTKATAGNNSYVIPLKFVNTLKAYVMQIRALFPQQELLFPIDVRTVNKQLKLWRASAHPHLFRDALNTRWQELNLDKDMREILLNQKPTSVNAKAYLKKYRSWPAHRLLYDNAFPY